MVEIPGGQAGHVYASIKDWTALVVLVCCVVAAWRRAVVKPARYHDRHATRPHGAEAYVILGLISLLMIADALSVDAADDVHELHGLFSGASFFGLPVTDRGRMVGVVRRAAIEEADRSGRQPWGRSIRGVLLLWTESGRFSTDRTITEYNRDIWKLEAVPPITGGDEQKT